MISKILNIPYSKNIAIIWWQKTLVNYSNSPSFSPIFTSSTTFPMQMDFNSPKFFPPNFLQPARALIRQTFFTAKVFYYMVAILGSGLLTSSMHMICTCACVQAYKQPLLLLYGYCALASQGLQQGSSGMAC